MSDDQAAAPAFGGNRAGEVRLYSALGSLLLLTAVGLGGCGSERSQEDAGGATTPAGSAGTAGQVGGSGAGGAAGSAGGSSVAVNPCPESPALHQLNQPIVELTFAPVLAGKPLIVGEPNTAAGGQVLPTDIRFYVSELSLMKGDGSVVPVDLVTPLGTAEPYGVHLVNFDEPQSAKIHVAAPSGTYAGARFTFGINDACNAGGTDRQPPLSVNSEMTWPHLAGFLFLRYEAQWTADAGATQAAPPGMIHMGGMVGRIAAPTATVAGSLSVQAGENPTRTVQVSFDEIFRGASSTEDVSDVPIPTPEVIAGERLRRAVPSLAIFEFAEP